MTVLQGVAHRLTPRCSRQSARMGFRQNAALLRAPLAADRVAVSPTKDMTRDADSWNPASAWRQLRLEAEAAEHYPSSYALYIAQTHRDVLLDGLLPQLLYVKAAAILDDAMDLWLSNNRYQLRHPYRNDLNGRLEYLKDKNLLQGVDILHGVRAKRNELAHEPDSKCQWATLRQDMVLIENALVSLGLARRTGDLQYFAERSAMQASQEPGVAFSRTFSYGVKESGKLALEIKFRQNFYDDGEAG